jgi:phosphoenolpyruvate-protein phosphotransferase (PTS system enzyme I)
VLRLVRQTCLAGKKAGIPVGMCGELAGDANMTEILVGLGLDELSMSAGAIPEVKEQIRSVQTNAAEAKSERALAQSDPDAVRRIAQE